MYAQTLMAVFIFLSPAAVAMGQDETRADEASKVTREWASRYEFGLVDGDKNIPLQRHPKSILRWSNPVAGELYGNVFVWTHEGRPEVVGSLLQWYSPHTHGSHEFHALSEGLITGSRNDRQLWKTSEGVQPKIVPDENEVGTTTAIRLRQMRAIAKRFTVEKTDRDDKVRELRMLTQPVYQFNDGNSDIIGGALFVFVQGTDPEVFLLLEAGKVDNQLKWHYSLARMNSVQFVVDYRAKEVWRVEIWPWGKARTGRESYFHSGKMDPL